MTSNIVSPRKKTEGEGRQLSPEQAAAAAMVAEARARGLELTGPTGLLKLFTKNVLETALNEEMTEHLGHEKNQAEAGRESTNVRNGARSKSVVSDAAGEVRIDVPRDREGTFEPQIVKKRQRRLTEVDEINRRWRFLTICGVNVPARSRGTSICTWPVFSVSTVLARVPLRMLPLPAPAGSCFC